MTRDVMVRYPVDLGEALAELAEHADTAKLIAGGTAFTILWRSGLLQAEHLISCARLDGLGDIGETGDTVELGALATLRAGEVAEVIRRRLPVLASTLGVVANLRVRNVATWGGNVAEADNTSDLPAVLVALDAEVDVAAQGRARTSTVAEVIVDFFETDLEPDEMITRVRIRPPAPGAGTSYVKFVSRSAEDRTCMGVAAVVERNDDGTCRDLRVAAVGAAPTPLRVPAAEAAARGERLTPSVVDELAGAYVEQSDPLSDIRGSAEYRRHVLPALITEAVTRAERGENRAVLV
jgi:carbon-monoxide dehydrogenase medium subunit